MLIYTLIKAALLGIIEGITEWLPISSTGHLILADEFINLPESHAFMEMFNVVIQLGAILAVIVIYFHKLNPFSPSKNHSEKKDTWVLWSKVLVACVPAAVIGLFLDDWLDDHFYNFITVASMLIIYGIAFIIVEIFKKNATAKTTTLEGLTYRTAALIGVFQLLALIPGTSRSGATILGAIIIGCSRFVAAEFSFFLGIPVMFGASILKVFKFFHAGHSLSGNQGLILFVACLVAFLVSVLAIRFLLKYIKNNDFKVFGYYRIVLGIILIIYWLH